MKSCFAHIKASPVAPFLGGGGGGGGGGEKCPATIVRDGDDTTPTNGAVSL